MISDNSLYAIWITQALGYSNHKIKLIYEKFNSFHNFYSGGKNNFLSCDFLNKNDVYKLLNTDLSKSQKIYDICLQKGYKLLSIEDDSYPQCLYNIYNPPALLYIKGNLPDVDNQLSIAIVGTRKPSDYGVRNAYLISYGLSKAGAIVISGGAKGIDSAAHNAALKADGKTVCILGCGLDYNYLNENKKMREEISRFGALITEFPPNYPPYAFNFPIRNRLMSALSNDVAVIEAKESSGSLITASCALEQGKSVFALMGNVDSENSIGTNNLIKDGAIPITGYQDVLDYYKDSFKIIYPNIKDDILNDIQSTLTKDKVDNIDNKIKGDESDVKNTSIPAKKSPDTIKNMDLSENAQIIYNLFSDKPLHIDTLVTLSRLPVFKVLPAITELEINGLIAGIQGRQYMLK